MTGTLTTHVLDTARGIPAAGMGIDLYRIDGAARTHLCRAVTNADYRTDAPILPEDVFQTGTYELVFHAGAWLDVIPIRFGMSQAGHYHVPLLLSPFAYSTGEAEARAGVLVWPEADGGGSER